MTNVFQLGFELLKLPVKLQTRHRPDDADSKCFVVLMHDQVQTEDMNEPCHAECYIHQNLTVVHNRPDQPYPAV